MVSPTVHCTLHSTDNGSPAGSPPFAPYQQSFVPLPSNGRGTTSLTASRLPSIAEDAAAPRTPPVGAKRRTSLRRDSAPSRIDLTNAKPAFSMDGQTESKCDSFRLPSSTFPRFANVSIVKHARIDPTRDSEMIESYSPTHDDILSPPPAAYTAHAGHTPIKIPDRPVLDISPAISHKSARSIDNLTECNTQFNLLDSAQNGQDSDDPELQGPLKLPGLPQDAGPDCFTMDMLTKRLQDISDDPGSNTPSSLRAPVNFTNDDDPTSADSSESTSEKQADVPDQDPPPPAKTSPQISGEKSPVPTPVEPDDDLNHRGIKLKKKPSCNFGAPLGQLGPLDRSRKS